MAIALKKRRVVAVLQESTRGTAVTPNPTNDALPTPREITFTINPVRVERPTLRLSLTPYPDTYPGVATCELKFTIELGGLPTNPKNDYDVPVWADCLRASGFEEVSNANGGAKPRLLYGVTSLTGGTAGTPLRHGETVTGNGTGPAGTGTVIGDFFAEDDVLVVQETAAPGTVPTPFTWTGGTSARVASGTHDTVASTPDSVVAFRLNSDVNYIAGPPVKGDTLSIYTYLDGKRLHTKGNMGTVEILLDHGDMIRGAFTFSGVVVPSTGYVDAAMPATPNESHKIAPTFLGKQVRIYEIASAPKGYGYDSGTFVNDPETPDRQIIGAVNTIHVNSGNNVVLRENSFDPSGVSFALITSRAPNGTFNPDEVLVTEYDWIGKFTAGVPMRFKAMIGKPGSETTAQDGNTIDVLAPGMVISGMGDGDRDGIHTWDGSFKITGGNYSTTAGQEIPGNDNELTLIYR